MSCGFCCKIYKCDHFRKSLSKILLVVTLCTFSFSIFFSKFSYYELREKLFEFIAERNFTELPFCQCTETEFIVFKDIGTLGYGLNHKTYDFTFAAMAAVRTNRILVDYSALLTPRHDMDLHGHERPHKRKDGMAKWHFSRLLDLTTVSFLINNTQVKKINYPC